MLKNLFLTSAILTLSACASIVDGRPDNVMLRTSDNSRAEVTVHAKSGPQTLFTPGVVKLEKSCRDISLTVMEDKQIHESNGVIHSGVNPWVFGNVVFGGLPGLAVDAVTGALCTYNKSVVIPVVRK